jgi:hypothetical protein
MKEIIEEKVNKFLNEIFELEGMDDFNRREWIFRKMYNEIEFKVDEFIKDKELEE